jgi:hypothetical protein
MRKERAVLDHTGTNPVPKKITGTCETLRETKPKRIPAKQPDPEVHLAAPMR